MKNGINCSSTNNQLFKLKLKLKLTVILIRVLTLVLHSIPYTLIYSKNASYLYPIFYQ